MKYELVKINRSDGLFQIRAIQEGPWGIVGTLGGFVQSEHNLSHKDNCWVYDNAQVFENALIYGNAIVFETALIFENSSISGEVRVSGNSKISGNAKVYENAWISEYAKVSGNAKISGKVNIYGNAQVYRHTQISGRAQISAGKHTKSPLHIEGSKDYITVCTAEVVNVGCESYPIDFWLENAQTIGKKNNYSEEEIKEYINYFKFIKSLLEG